MLIDARAYLFETYLDIVFLYSFYTLIETHKSSVLAKVIGFVLTPVILYLNVYSDFSVYLAYGLALYWLNYRFNFKPAGINLVLFSCLALAMSALLTNAIVAPFVSQHTKQGWGFVLVCAAIKAAMMLAILVGLKAKVNVLFRKKDFNNVLIFLQSSLLVIMYFFVRLTKKLGIFDRFTLGTLAFTGAEFLLLTGLFWLAYIRTKRHYQARIEQQELDNLTAYTEQLEQSQLELRKFRHDYKNMLLSVSELAQRGDLAAVNAYLDELQVYSNQELSEATDRYQDIGNVQEIHMKSILLSKFFNMSHQKIDYQFECRIPVKTVTINPFDMVRLLSITLDNAIEAVQDSPTKKISVVIFQSATDLRLTIANTTDETPTSFDELSQPGVTTKAQHRGLGLSIINDLRRKYPQLLVSQQSDQGMFTIQLVIGQ